MGGAFLTSREIFDNPIWQDVQKFRIFFYIYGNAVFAEEGVRIADITVKRGQFLRSYRNLAKDLEYIENRAVKSYSISVIKRKVDSLVKEGRLKIEDTELGTLFTVVNYQQYQGFERYKRGNMEQRWNSDGTALEQTENNNKKDIKVNQDIKDISTTKAPNAFEVYEQNFGMLKPLVIEDINYWIDHLNEEIVIASMKVAVKRNKTSFGYCEGILKSWLAQGVKTIDDARALERKEGANNNESATRNVQADSSGPGLNALSL